MPTEIRADDPSGAHAVSNAARAVLQAWPGAAFVIDPKAALLITANERGRALFPALPVALDGAMPAVRALRDMVRAGGGPWPAVPLVFWTASGITDLACDVALIDGPSPLLRVCAVAEGERAARAAPAQESDGRSDAETLRNIADKIRAGQSRYMASAPGRERGQSGLSLELDPVAPGDEAVPRGIDLAKLAHELKTPLSAIAAASEIMKEGRFGEIGNEKYAGYITDIHASARHALDLIQRMIDQRIGAEPTRSHDLMFEALDLDVLVEACLSTLRPLAAEKGLTLVSRRAQTPAKVRADATALKQIILNLVTNGMKFTPVGGRITVATVGSRRGAAAMTVEDTGAGMSAMEIAEALRPVPNDVPRKREGGGLGLGLPMSLVLAEAMGASMSIDSAPGRGTCVTVAFPGGPLVAI